jgi:signal peptidase I
MAGAVDTLRIAARRPPWKILLGAWVALFVAGSILQATVTDYYKAHYTRAYRIPSATMEPTLLLGDHILTDNAVYRAQQPRRGDIVVFKYPGDEQRDFLKRIVGVPGDEIALRGEQVYVNGRLLEEPYVQAGAAPSPTAASCGYAYGCQPLLVPADSFFVLGDNRERSVDSRYWGFVKREKIVGRALVIYWSWDPARHWPRFERVGHSL